MAMSKFWATLGPAVVTCISREQGRAALSAGGRHASLPPVHSTPFSQTAVRKRSSLVAIEPAMPG